MVIQQTAESFRAWKTPQRKDNHEDEPKREYNKEAINRKYDKEAHTKTMLQRKGDKQNAIKKCRLEIATTNGDAKW